MITLIIIAIIGLGLFFTRKLWASYIVLLFKKRDPKTINKADNVLFFPSGTIRTLDISLTIEETGDGSVKISVANKKMKEL